MKGIQLLIQCFLLSIAECGKWCYKMKGIQLLIQCFLLSIAECGSHSLQFLSTGRVQPGDRPLFEQLTVFDGVPISYCDSLKRTEEIKPTLQSKNFPESCDESCNNILESLHVIPTFTNRTVYVVQRRRGCILSANGIVSASEAWAVNGRDFISFDPESQKWMAQSPSAVTVKRHWNNNIARNSAFRHFISEQCPLLIQDIQLTSMHQRTELQVFAKPIVNTVEAILICHVMSTDKSVSSVHLIGDGASKASGITITGPVPSEDGSVILRLTAWISLSQNTNTYGCRILTGGHNFTVFWDGNALDGRHLYNKSSVNWSILTITLGFFCIVVIITIICYGTIFLLKCVTVRSSRPPTVDPRLVEQFSRMMESVTSPDLRNIIVSYTQCTERNREWDQWAVRFTAEDQDFYDPEHFARNVDGAHR